MVASQKLLLTVAREAIEDAGLDLYDNENRNIGVFVASSHLVDKSGGFKAVSVHDATGSALSVAAGRISFTFGFTGPCVTIDTACSSSLVALNAAQKSLQNGECEIALVLGVNILSDEVSVPFAYARLLSPTGKCHTFDESADGYCRGEGCGALLLTVKPTDRRIYAVLKGSAIRQDGRSSSLMAPSHEAQMQVITAALKDAGVSAASIRAVECHGTGTRMGDMAEVRALAALFMSEMEVPKRQDTLLVSSAKGTFGHLEAAAGMVGLFNAIVMLRYAQVPPNAQLYSLSGELDNLTKGLPIEFPIKPQSISNSHSETPVLVGVSSFGYSGTIAHAVLQQASSPLTQSSLPSFHENHALPLSKRIESGIWLFNDLPVVSLYDFFHLYNANKSFRHNFNDCEAIIESLLSKKISTILYPNISDTLTEAEAQDLHLMCLKSRKLFRCL